MTESITILRPNAAGGTDAQGNPNVAADTSIVSDGWAVAPLSADEDSLATGQSVVDGFTLYRRDAWVDIRLNDRVNVRGQVYAVDSSTEKWAHPLKSRIGTVVTVRRAS